jgi:hypothetical protein
VNKIDAALVSLRQKVNVPKDEFRDWCADGKGAAQLLVIRTLRLLRPITNLLAAGLSKFIRFMLGRESLAILGDWISKTFCSEQSAGEIIVVAVKK